MCLLDIHGDQLHSAGLEFKVGDFVVLKDEISSSPGEAARAGGIAGKVFVVLDVPIKNDPKVFFENKYCVSTIKNNVLKNYEYYGGQLIKYEGEIVETSPLMLLSKIFKKKIKISDEIMNRLEAGEILLNEIPTYTEIDELR